MHPNDFAMERIKQAEAKADAVFASDLGLKPGQWPATIERGGVAYFRGQPTRNIDGELESVEYYSAGYRLTVWND